MSSIYLIYQKLNVFHKYQIIDFFDLEEQTYIRRELYQIIQKIYTYELISGDIIENIKKLEDFRYFTEKDFQCILTKFEQNLCTCDMILTCIFAYFNNIQQLDLIRQHYREISTVNSSILPPFFPKICTFIICGNSKDVIYWLYRHSPRLINLLKLYIDMSNNRELYLWYNNTFVYICDS
jgi:hypothetical protein